MVACCDRRLFGETVVLYEVVVTMVVVDSRKKKRKKKLEKIPKLFYSNMNTVQCKLTVNSSFTVFEFFNKKWALFSYCNISITSFIYTVR